jgi:hypothetical protein
VLLPDRTFDYKAFRRGDKVIYGVVHRFDKAQMVFGPFESFSVTMDLVDALNHGLKYRDDRELAEIPEID